MKKRFFLLLALTAALLLVTGTALASEYGSDGHWHYAYCDNPTVCAVCGEPYSGDDVRHEWSDVWQYNDWSHWVTCNRCGERDPNRPSVHAAACDNPGVCADCGQPYSGNNVRHGVAVYQYTETECWAICDKCGQELEGFPRSEHIAACNRPGVCCHCGQPYSGSNISHQWNWQYNETECWQECSQCGAVQSKGEHAASCDFPGRCCHCGQPYSGSNVEHDWGEYQYNDTEHWQVCNRCGEERYRNSHAALCKELGKCADCGAPYFGDIVWHWVDDWQYNETEHWLVCTRCGEEQERGEHWAKCDNPGVCAQCGAPYSGDDIEHYWSDDWQYNDTEHWLYCTVCNEKLYGDEHWAWCDNPGVCAECGASYSGDDISHDLNWDDYQYNETEHWLICTRCGEEQKRGEHWAKCDNPGVCAQCGAPYSGSNVEHDWGEYQYNDTEHWQVCIQCGEEQNRQNHLAACDNPGTCATCGAPCDIVGAHGYSTIQYNETEHWVICTQCGKEIYREEHEAKCDNPGVCYFCLQPYSGSNVEHTWGDKQYNETEHWAYCTKCGEEVYREKHWARCDKPGICGSCGAPYSGDTIYHSWDEDDLHYDETNHWLICDWCREEMHKEEHWATCDHPDVCNVCGSPYSGSNIVHYYDDEVGIQYQHDETNHWCVCVVCGEKYDVAAHTYGDDGVCTVCDYSKPAVTDAPTAAPTEKPTEQPTEAPTATPTVKPTEKPTEAPTDAPTDTPHEHEWTVTSETPATCENEGVIAYSCACGETKLETVKALGHNFVDFVSRGDGTHRSDCTRCGVFTVKSCQMQSRTVLGIACEVCGVCGYVHIPELDGIALPEAPVTDAMAVTTTGEAAAILVFDVTASLPEDSTFALCLQVMPQDGAAMPGSVRVTIPCTVDTTGLRLVFIPEGGLPEAVPFGVGGGMITFNATAPGIFALVPIQE